MKTKHTPRGAATVAEVKAGDCGGAIPEFGRWQDVERLFGLRRSYLYTLLADGAIKSVNLRRPGCKTGCRLFHLQSIREFLQSHLDNPSRERTA
jgi:hypothetical protein